MYCTTCFPGPFPPTHAQTEAFKRGYEIAKTKKTASTKKLKRTYATLGFSQEAKREVKRRCKNFEDLKDRKDRKDRKDQKLTLPAKGRTGDCKGPETFVATLKGRQVSVTCEQNSEFKVEVDLDDLSACQGQTQGNPPPGETIHARILGRNILRMDSLETPPFWLEIDVSLAPLPSQ